jgi:hypothetical protein
LAKVASKDTQTVVSALIRQAKTIPNELYKSLTWDRGKELADHRRFTLATNIDVYAVSVNLGLFCYMFQDGRHLAGRAQTLQDARKPMHTDPSTI